MASFDFGPIRCEGGTENAVIGGKAAFRTILVLQKEGVSRVEIVAWKLAA